MILVSEMRRVVGCIKDGCEHECLLCCMKLVCGFRGLEIKGKWALNAQRLKREVEDGIHSRTGDSEDASTR